MVNFIFWLCLTIIGYTYIGYPLLLWLLARVSPLEVAAAPIMPDVTVVIAAMNEEKNIGDRLDNILSQEYSPERFEIIVVSDGSTDRTDEIVQSYKERNVTLLKLESRQGKAIALNEGINSASGEIIVFTDARQCFAPGAILQLAANFADSSVGCVSGELMFFDNNSGIQAEMGGYWRFEKWIRSNESRSGSVVGATGSIYAIRKALYQPLPSGTILDDVLTPLNVVMQGYRCIFDGGAIVYDIISETVNQEWRRKVRTLAGNWQLLSLRPALLLPSLNPILWRLISHKLLRLVVPFALVILFCSGATLPHPFYRSATIAQLFIYLFALTGYLLPLSRNLRLINISYFFAVMNIAALCGFWHWLTGNCGSIWQPAYQGKR